MKRETDNHESGAGSDSIPPDPKIEYSSPLGALLVSDIERALDSTYLKGMVGKVDLIFTSPPFPLVRKKGYGNEDARKFLGWLKGLAKQLVTLLSPTGSIVMEIGNAWDEGSPTMSTLPLRALMAFQQAGKLKLCQHVICNNPARLPSPAEWVTVRRIRLKDSFTHVWWMSPTEFPKADNKRVLFPYSKHMKNLLRTQTYNAGERPSGHVISERGFLKDNGGAIAPSFLEIAETDSRLPRSALQFSNTSWDADYVAYCKDNALPLHPAQMRPELAAFFIEFLTNEGDVVLDPFAGSNTTGAVAQALGRRWVGVERDEKYARGSKGRFIVDYAKNKNKTESRSK